MGGTDMKRVHRELAALMKNLHSQFDGQVKLRESTFEFEDDDIPVIRFAICPHDGVYKDCEIEFSMELCHYPTDLPLVLPESNILHPNIDYDSYNKSVCLNLLDEWRSYDDSYRSLDLVVQGMLFLFYEPEIEDAVNPEVAFSTMAELQEAVDKTKYGGSTNDCSSDWIPFIEYDEIYKGPIPQNTMDEEQGDSENTTDTTSVEDNGSSESIAAEPDSVSQTTKNESHPATTTTENEQASESERQTDSIPDTAAQNWISQEGCEGIHGTDSNTATSLAEKPQTQDESLKDSESQSHEGNNATTGQALDEGFEMNRHEIFHNNGVEHTHTASSDAVRTEKDSVRDIVLEEEIQCMKTQRTPIVDIGSTNETLSTAIRSID